MNSFEVALNLKFEDAQKGFNLDKRLVGVLKDNHITHLGYLIGFDFQQFKKFRNLGKESINKLENFLKKIGFESEVSMPSWFHDENLEGEAFRIISYVIIENKKITNFLDDEIKNYLEENKIIDGHFQELIKKFLNEYSLNDFVNTFKDYFKDDTGGLDKYGEILKLRYLDGFRLKAIGDKYNLSRERIRQIIEKGIRQFKRYANLKQIFLKDFLEQEKKNIWLILVQEQDNKNILIKIKLRNNLLEYKKTNRNGLYDLLIKMYFHNFENYLRINFKDSHEFIEFD